MHSKARILVITLIAISICPSFVYSNEDFCTSKNGIQLCTGLQYAGAVDWLVYQNKQFIDANDHGRQMQVRIGTGAGTCYYLLEAGTQNDGTSSTSTSRLLGVNISQAGVLRATTQMSYWLPPGSPCAQNTVALSNYVVDKTVSIGVDVFPNAMMFAFNLYVPESQSLLQIETPTAAMPVDFSSFYTLNLVTNELKSQPISASNQYGTTADPTIVATSDGSYAMGSFLNYGPPSSIPISYKQAFIPPGSGSIGVWTNRWQGSATAGSVLSFGSVVCVGTLSQVQACMFGLAQRIGFYEKQNYCIGTTDLQVCGSSRTAGAIDSIVYKSTQLLDAYDHGRELQVRILNGTDLCYFALEAGSSADATAMYSTSQLLSVSTNNGVLQTSTRPAFWSQPGTCNSASYIPPVSSYVIDKAVTIAQYPNSISFKFNVTVPDVQSSLQIESPVGYMPVSFSVFYSIDLATGQLTSVPASSQGSSSSNPTIVTNSSSNIAMGSFMTYAPTTNVIYQQAYYGPGSGSTAKWSSLWQGGAAAGSVLSFSSVICIGTLSEVQACMFSLAQTVGYVGKPAPPTVAPTTAAPTEAPTTAPQTTEAPTTALLTVAQTTTPPTVAQTTAPPTVSPTTAAPTMRPSVTSSSTSAARASSLAGLSTTSSSLSASKLSASTSSSASQSETSSTSKSMTTTSIAASISSTTAVSSTTRGTTTAAAQVSSSSTIATKSTTSSASVASASSTKSVSTSSSISASKISSSSSTSNKAALLSSTSSTSGAM